MGRRRGTALVQPLWPQHPSRWERVPVPQPRRRSVAGRREYGLKWRALVHAAEAVGWVPADLAGQGVSGLNAARVQAGMRPWSDRTLAYYAKLVVYSGLAWDYHPAGDGPLLADELAARALWRPDRWTKAAAWRTAAVARLAWQWPAPPAVWLALAASDVTELGESGLRIRVPEFAGGGVAELAEGLPQWREWLRERVRLGVSQAPAICTTEAGPHDSHRGQRLSVRAFQAAFARHAVACGRAGLSYERYRAAAVAAGSAVVGGRGRVRAARSVRPVALPEQWGAAGRTPVAVPSPR